MDAKGIKALQEENKNLKAAEATQKEEIAKLTIVNNDLIGQLSEQDGAIKDLQADNEKLKQANQKLLATNKKLSNTSSKNTSEPREKDLEKTIQQLKKDLVAEKVLSGKLRKQVEKYNKNGRPVTPIKGTYVSKKDEKEYKFRDNISKFYGIAGQLDSEKVLADANKGDVKAITELERLIKLKSTVFIEVE